MIIGGYPDKFKFRDMDPKDPSRTFNKEKFGLPADFYKYKMPVIEISDPRSKSSFITFFMINGNEYLIPKVDETLWPNYPGGKYHHEEGLYHRDVSVRKAYPWRQHYHVPLDHHPKKADLKWFIETIRKHENEDFQFINPKLEQEIMNFCDTLKILQ